MKPLPIPDNEQITAMLSGSILDLLREYVPSPEFTDFRKYLTVSRQKLLDYLAHHPEMTESYYRHQQSLHAIHDVNVIGPFDEGFAVCTMDHGVPTDRRIFKTLAEAVTEHVLCSHGMH
jgi:hypothetical protein